MLKTSKQGNKKEKERFQTEKSKTKRKLKKTKNKNKQKQKNQHGLEWVLYIFVKALKIQDYIINTPPESQIYMICVNRCIFDGISVFDVIQNDIVKYTTETRCKVCLVGDFNAHTGLKTDFTDINDYVLNSVQLDDVINIVNLDTLGIDVTHHNLDLSLNNYGNRLLQMCQSLELLTANGRLGRDQGVGALTCKNTTVVGYCILSPELFACVSEFEVLDPIISDVHNTLHVEILCKSTCIVKNDGIDLVEPSIHVKAVWDNNNCQSFNDFLNIENIARLNDKLDNIDIANVNKDSINSLIDDCNDIIIEAASASGMLKEQRVEKNNCHGLTKSVIKKEKSIIEPKVIIGGLNL